MIHIPGLFIAQTESKGRGVFTSEDLAIRDLIEICPVLKIPVGQLPYLDLTIIHDYYFLWK